jgi:uncharacterized protein
MIGNTGIDLLYSASGFCVGVLVGMTGVGGGSLMTPLLIILFDIHPATAVGSDLLYAAATKSVGTVFHGLHGTVDWRIVGRLASGSIPATGVVLFSLAHFDINSDLVQGMMTGVLGGALFATAAVLIFRRQILAFYAARVGELGARRTAALTVLVGALLGALVSLTSVGAGALGITAVLLLYPRLPTSRIVGCDIAHAVPLTLVAGIGHWTLGSIDWHLLGSLLVGSVPGVLFGSQIATRVPEPALRFTLAATLVLVAGRLVF